MPMKPVDRIDGTNASAVTGEVVLDKQKIIWNGGLIISCLFTLPFHMAMDAALLFIGFTYFTLLFGHSIGMHRLMIHRTFRTSRWLFRILVYIGTLVGMGGPSKIIYVHDIRDWAQRQKKCHAFFAHTESYWKDLFWQLFYKFKFEKPPNVNIEVAISNDPFLTFLDKTWMLHQLLLALVLFYIGGVTWIVWGVFLRVPFSIISHWTITYICHNPGPGVWQVKNAYVQASNIHLSILSCGECWHNNHHAFPESAQIGIEPHQKDPAWWVIKFLGKLGLACDLGQPRPENEQDDLIRK